MKGKLEKTLREARRDLVPNESPDWDAIDAKLFARIEADKKATDASRVARLTSQPRAWGVVATALAVAAGVALFVAHKSQKPNSHVARNGLSSESASAGAAKASALVLQRGADQVLVGGAPIAPSLKIATDVRAGDTVETRRTTAFFERPGAVTWTLEEESRISITKAAGTLIVSLERGAVEAQVTPVASGEAFAVDIAASNEPNAVITRVAVHGTRLRVARIEGRAKGATVIVDLSEGVVSIGAPPRFGSTYGTLVTAPAHIEFDAGDPSTIHVSHQLSDVRAPLDLAAAIGTPSPVSMNSSTAPDPHSGSEAARDAHPPAPVAVLAPAVPQKPAAATPAAPERDPNAEQTVASAVKACMAGRPQAADAQVRVTVSSMLELRISDIGAVDLAKFDPPLPVDVQSCAANAIYKTRFSNRGTVRIKLEF